MDEERQEMLQVLNGLLEWEAQQGGWEAECWVRARRLRDLLSEQLAGPTLHPGGYTGILWEKRIREALEGVYELEDDLEDDMAADDQWSADSSRAWLGKERAQLLKMVDEYWKLCKQLPPGWSSLTDIPPRPADGG